MVPPTKNSEGVPPTTQIPVFERVAFFYARRRLRKNKEVWIRKSMLRQFLR
ncbi:ribosomal protein S4 [Iris pallida]|uniref:Ribosomal protein S4 (Mitochondrion) n=1 Tax=Iris pallida TaxID=29817 RepID=A0AAX6FR46_IRIPA|nr:ribosomal protein S4 [Iris pallida]